ncbi:MAG: DUF3570 domain-containing protein [Candidatus Obscuribacterales bacterium]|nr:DUF3570 domain-containing protein [Steroidobacteraceae bacterium]
MRTVRCSIWQQSLWLATLCCLSYATNAAVLPEDRADVMYHSYDGGGVTVNGPSLLVRKKFGESVSVAANYYIDMVTSASIDVEVSGASEYKEERTQSSLSVDYLRGKTTYNLSYINSEESDYTADTASIGISEDMFGDLTTVSIGYTRAWDLVGKNVKTNGVLGPDPNFVEKTVDHRSYRLGISQVITKHLIVGVNYEAQSHEGHLGNPYRSFRYLDINNLERFVLENYPATRTTNAVSLNARYFLPYRAAVHGSYRVFRDTWGIVADTMEIGYTHPWRSAWIFEGSYRYHKQEAADFYADLFPRENFQNFQARDRNLSSMNNQTIHLGVSYELTSPWSWLEKGSANLFIDRVVFDFKDFRDARMSKTNFTNTPVAPGTEPMHTESANVIRFFISVWF